MDLLQSFQRLINTAVTKVNTSPKGALPVVLISTHGSYQIIQTTVGRGIDRVEEEYIEQYPLPSGMKVYKIETAAFGVVNLQNTSNVDEVCIDLKKYMHDTRTVNELIDDLVIRIENIHTEHTIKTYDEDEEVAAFTTAANRRQMNTYQLINTLDSEYPNKQPLYYQKSFSRDLRKITNKNAESDEDYESDDLILYNNSEYDMRINLIQYSFATRYLGPKIQDIYDDIIRYQLENGKSGEEVFLSEMMNYLHSTGINEFIIVDLSCSVFNDMEGYRIDVSKNTERLSRLFRREQYRNTSSPIVRLDSRSRSNSFTRLSPINNNRNSPTWRKMLGPDRGGKRSKKYRRTKKRSKTHRNKKSQNKIR